MPIPYTVDSLDSIPAQFHELYTQSGDKFIATGITGVKTQADIDRIQGALTKERNDHKAIKQKFAPLLDRDITEVVADLDRIPELEAAASGKVDDKAIERIVTSRLAPINRELEQTKVKLTEQTQLNQTLEQGITTRTVTDAVRDAALKAKVTPDAIDDVLLYADRVFHVENGQVVTKDGVGITPGLDPAAWITDMQPKRPHWWPASVGGGAGGGNSFGGASNPWSAKSWNMTEQARMYRENPDLAGQMAKLAGTSIGGPKPTK